MPHPEKHRILGVHVTERMQRAGAVQAVLSQYGCNIKTRLGLHEVDDRFCSPNGLILLELVGEDALCEELGAKLGEIEGVDVQEMVFAH